MYTCTVSTARRGGEVPHTSSTSRSTGYRPAGLGQRHGEQGALTSGGCQAQTSPSRTCKGPSTRNRGPGITPSPGQIAYLVQQLQPPDGNTAGRRPHAPSMAQCAGDEYRRDVWSRAPTTQGILNSYDARALQAGDQRIALGCEASCQLAPTLGAVFHSVGQLIQR